MKKIFTLLTMLVMLAFSSQAAYYIVGSAPFGGWNPSSGMVMTQNSDGNYSVTVTLSGTVYFVFADGLASSSSDWDTFNSNYRIGPTGSSDETVEAGKWITTQKAPRGSKSYKFNAAGDNYVITFNPTSMQFKVEGYVEPFVLESCTVSGAPASVFGTEWDPSNTDNDMILQADGTYKLQKFGCELGAGSNLAFKVAANHDWGYSWPENDIIIPIEESGLYDITFTFNPENYDVDCVLKKQGSFDPRTGELFILGNANGNSWGPSVGEKMTTEDGNIFTASFFTNGENIDENDGNGYSYFSFTTKLAESSSDWDGIAGYRVGATVNDYLLSADQLGIDLALGGFGNSNSFKIPAGEYEVTVNLDAMTMVINAVVAPEPTDPPVITYDEETLTVTATGEGEIHLYINGEEVNNPYTFEQTDVDVTYTVTATAQGEGKEISEVATLEVIVPAMVVEPNPYKIEKVWEIADLSFLPFGDNRQGFGMNGKFYINNKADKIISVIDKDGLANTSYPGGANCGITRDEAGNLVVSNAAFPDPWSAEATIKVINPETNEVNEYVVPEECAISGRSDFIGFAKGNLMEDGVLYMVGATNDGVSILTIAGGEVSADESYVASCDGLTPSNMTVINFYEDLAGEESLLYVTRNAAPAKLAFEGDNFTATNFTLPNKGACNGTFPFIWDGKELFVYPTLPNYQDGFAVAEANAEAPIIEVPSTVTANANNYSANWLNAEVDKDGVTIYQYYPGGHITVYRLTKDSGSVDELINDNNKIVANVRYYNIMGQEMQQANGITIVVTTYTDGTRSAVKVIK